MTTTNNMIIGTPNWYDRVTWTAASQQADYPAAAVTSLPLSYVWRSAATVTTTTLTGQLDQPRRVRMVVVVNHNLSPTGQVRVRLYADAGMTQLQWDSGWVDAWPAIYSTDSLDWLDPNWWGGRYTADEIASMIGAVGVVADRSYGPAAVRVDLADPDNPDGYLQAGFIDVSGVLQLPVNFSVGAKAGHRVLDDTSRSRAGVLDGVTGARLRNFRGGVDYGNRMESRATVGEFLGRHGKLRPFFIIPEPGNTLERARLSFLAVNADIGLGDYATALYHSYPLSFEEAL